ncbi:hypothetical protein SAY86_000034 [Trapa natans]|uniref:MINDY deubiquitinase domain-containing protein n=1 Tax=Trapa natans TaxID=22666 RepID=A0AAN7MWT8_TRANT|nr:hypothetical protein SAY86_000034 [Trapa natans]
MATSSSSPSMEEQPWDELQQQHQMPIPKEKECFHKTKIIQFLGRTTPVILQNDNGPCPLLAICNVLLLRNNLNLSSDTTEVSQEKLLSLVAERLIDSNSNVNNKDDEYLENQQKNIADAIDLLPRLATGIDVNIQFRRIDDFEFTPECAIFDLLDIPLYHGWIVDPQDHDTANAIASKSYNGITGELVALDTEAFSKEHKSSLADEDCVDFAAATAATLGMPSPILSKVRSFDDPSHTVADDRAMRKGDLDEEEELLRALKLSEVEVLNSLGSAVGHDGGDESVSVMEIKCTESSDSANIIHASKDQAVLESTNHKVEASESNACIKNDEESSGAHAEGAMGSFLSEDVGDCPVQFKQEKPIEALPADAAVGEKNVDPLVHIEDTAHVSKQYDFIDEVPKDLLRESEEAGNFPAPPDHNFEEAKTISGDSATVLSSNFEPYAGTDSSGVRLQNLDETDAFTPSIDDSEPIYEGEECILDSRPTHFEDREPVYEGEVVLAREADKCAEDAQGVGSKTELTPHQGELVRNFLKNNASQLTFYGLFCLQDGLKERELCVFFRNNHFSTMFKYEGELYLLATDQGYINQPDLVWEKLNEVNGDSLFMTGTFKEFNVENQSNGIWDEHNAMANTADYLASIDSAAKAGLDVNADLQLAIALQQQELEQQQQRQGSQQTSVGSSRLVVGPQVPRNSHVPSSTRPDAKSKDKCSIM